MGQSKESAYGWEMRTLLTRAMPEHLKSEEPCDHEWDDEQICLYNNLHYRCKKCGVLE